MAPFKSEMMQVLAERGFMHQCSDPAGLDGLAAKEPITGYIGFDCTAPSLHVGSLVQIMMLRWLQKTGHKPIALMGGGTTRVGDPSGKDESRKILSDEEIEANKARHQAGLCQVPDIRRRRQRRADDRQCRLAARAELRRVPARGRPAHLGQPDDPARFGEAPPRARAAPVLPRVQLHGPAGLRLRRAGAAPWLPAAARRLGPVGQHRRRHRPRPAHGRTSSCSPSPRR